MEPRPRGRGNSCRREATTGNALAFNGAPTSRPGKHGLALLQRAVAIAPSMEPRPRGRGNAATPLHIACVSSLQWSPDLAAGETRGSSEPRQARRLPSMEPRPRGRGNKGWRFMGYGDFKPLQWSPDLAAGETSPASRSTTPASTSFNGAPTSRPGKLFDKVSQALAGVHLQWS